MTGPVFGSPVLFLFVFKAALNGFLVVLALSTHEIFEGIALGLFSVQSSVWFLFVAISLHKYVISFCLGMQFIAAGNYKLFQILELR